MRTGTHKVRLLVGTYRVLCEVESGMVMIVRVDKVT
jgi:hypothetical protein